MDGTLCSMGEIIRRLVWFFFVASIGSYAVFLLVGGTIHAEAIDLSRVVQVRDVLKPGVHALSGMVMVSRTCDELVVATQEISATVHKLEFKTWQQPSIPCITEDVPRSFRASVVAPAAGVDFIATLNDLPLTVVVYQEIAQR